MVYRYSNQPQVGSLAGIGSLGYGSVVTNPQNAPYSMGYSMGIPEPIPAPVYSPGVATTVPANNLMTPAIESLSTPATDFGAANQFGVAGNDALSGALTGALSSNVDNGIGGILKSTFLNKNGGLNVGNITGLLSSIAGIYGGFQQLGLAKDSLALSKEAFRVNTENQRKSYNTALEDRAAGRYSASNPDRAKADEYVKRNSL